jgi:hypothetical protein
MSDHNVSSPLDTQPSEGKKESSLAADTGGKRPWSAPAVTKLSVAEVTKSSPGVGMDMDGRS